MLGNCVLVAIIRTDNIRGGVIAREGQLSYIHCYAQHTHAHSYIHSGFTSKLFN